jgi:hypothetical protein
MHRCVNLVPLAFAMGTAVTLPARTAAAQDSAVDRADDLFREGRDAMRRHKYMEACAKFRESDVLDPSPGTKLNWALCDEQLGRLAQALEHARWALDRLNPADDRHSIAEGLAAALEKRVPRLTMRLSRGAGASAKVFLDGEPLAMKGTEETRAVDPGEHVIFVEQPLHETARWVVILQEGESSLREVSAGPEWSTGQGAKRPALSTTPHESTRRTAGYLLGGVAAASLVATGILSVLVASEQSIVTQHCPNKVCDPQGFEAGDRGRTYVRGAVMTLGVGVAGAVGSAVLLWPHSADTHAMASVVPLQGGAGVVFGGAL